VIDLVGLKGREGYYPRELSGGQQQRVGIARSLAVEPDVWFLDEPFSALDPLIRREMQDEFLRLQSLLKKTIVFITHDFDEAIRLADRIAIMNHGEIVQIGTPVDLVTNPATAYVAEFTKEVARDRLLTVASVMGKKAAGRKAAFTVLAGERLAGVAGAILKSSQPVAVVDDAGAVVGAIARDQVIEALFGAADGGAVA
jgi:glycine betaine/proline transport system ATP-binding protein